MLRVGLTGGIASGKSTILSNFRELGCLTADADKLVAELYRPGHAGHAALIAKYGERILREDGEIDRVQLANLAFASPDAAKELNAVIHPLVMQHTDDLLNDYARAHPDGIAVVEATLLLEAGGKQRYNRIVVVDVRPEVQLARGVARGMTREEVERRMANQMPREQRLALADYVIDNSGSVEEGRAETGRVYAALRDETNGTHRTDGS